jgi:dGTPase
MILPSGVSAQPDRSRGRLHSEERSGPRGPRDIFQRDRDRIVHSVAFRRLRHKTQVFVAPDGDHFRVRLTHSLEVAQIARTLARAIGVNEDLTEALALAHDLGHPPFGHAGERALAGAMQAAGGFDHNEHTIRLVTRLEQPYPGFDGLNLCWELLEGLAKHNGPVPEPGWALSCYDSRHPLALDQWPSLEAQLAALADDIAYDNHDLDDGLRGGLFSIEQMLAVPFIADGWREVVRQYPGCSAERLVPELIRRQIGLMVEDVLDETRARLTLLDPAGEDDVRGAGRAIASFTSAGYESERSVKAFLREHMYRHEHVLSLSAGAEAIVTQLFQAYAAEPELMGPSWSAGLPEEEPWRTRHVGDYIAGMTDRFAIRAYQKLFGRAPLPEDVQF